MDMPSKIRARVESGKFFPDDIKHSGRLTDDEIARMPTDLIYVLITAGLWKKNDFEKWLKVMYIL